MPRTALPAGNIYEVAKKKKHLITHRPKPYPLPPQKILEHMYEIQNKKARALYAFIYLTGARVSEAVNFKPVNLIYEDDELVRVRLEVLKRRDEIPPRRTVPIPKTEKIAKCFEHKFWEEVREYISKFDGLERPFAVWRNMSEWLAREVPPIQVLAVLPSGIEGYIEKRFNPHFLRHARASHLVEYYGAGDHQLRIFFGWADTRMASRYVEMREADAIFLNAKNIYTREDEVKT